MGKAIKVKGAKRIRNKEIIPFTRQLASMLGAGMTILASIQTLGEQCADQEFKKVLQHLCDVIESGAPMSNGLAEYPQLFDDMYVNMVIAGEQSGEFAGIMKRLAAILQSSSRLRKKVKSAMTYPTVIISIAMLLDRGRRVHLQALEGHAGRTPRVRPLQTQATGFWTPEPEGGDRTLLPSARADDRGRRADPQVAGGSVAAGVPILKSLEVVAGSLDNFVLENSVLAARREVEQGNQLSPSLQGKPFMPILMIRMLAAGEKAGKVEDMLESVADSYDEEVEVMLATLTSLMEPFLMVFLGVVIGTIVTAMFLPIFNLGSLAS